MRKAQAALEFLLTYGWALLAILVVMGTLAYMTGMTNKFVPSRCTMTPPFICAEVKAQDMGTSTALYLGVENTVKDMATAQLDVYCEDDTVPWSRTEQPFPTMTRMNGTLLYIACPETSGLLRARFDLTYRYAGEDTIHDASGTLRTYVE